MTNITNQRDNSVRKVRVGKYPLLRKLLVGFIAISLVNLAISYFVYTPKIYSIDSENHTILIKEAIL